jgi:anti-anti-sigma factor
MTASEAPRDPLTPGQASWLELQPPFDVAIHRDGDRMVVVPAGELDLATVDRLAASVQGLVEMGCEAIVLDLRRLTFMDSTGLRLVLAECRRPEVAIRVIDGAEVVARLFDICRVRDSVSFMDARELQRTPG